MNNMKHQLYEKRMRTAPCFAQASAISFISLLPNQNKTSMPLASSLSTAAMRSSHKSIFFTHSPLAVVQSLFIHVKTYAQIPFTTYAESDAITTREKPSRAQLRTLSAVIAPSNSARLDVGG